ncbi:MAG: hypothetical protein ACI9DG_000384 [Oleispira sp.]|jgi:hypothetical protein
MKWIPVFSFAIVTSLGISSLDSVITPHDSSKIELSRLLANQIYSAAFNEISPAFDDLYVIKTQDKGREIIIYCNATYCYKNHNSLMTS